MTSRISLRGLRRLIQDDKIKYNIHNISVVTEGMLFKLKRFLPSSAVKCFTHNPRFSVRAALDPLGFRWSVLGQDTSKTQPSTSETQEGNEKHELSA